LYLSVGVLPAINLRVILTGKTQRSVKNVVLNDQKLAQTEIQHCLVNAGDVGCGVFECFENNSCEIRGLHEICMTFLHNAGKFDAQGKSFIKDALKCKAHALRHKFSCISRKCPAIKEMVFQLQRECYLKHDLCSAAKENVQVIVEMIHFKDLLQHDQSVGAPSRSASGLCICPRAVSPPSGLQHLLFSHVQHQGRALFAGPLELDMVA
ncbi:hypothetical protein EK904_006530, partial [Melospiza melodia maxima]